MKRFDTKGQLSSARLSHRIRHSDSFFYPMSRCRLLGNQLPWRAFPVCVCPSMPAAALTFPLTVAPNSPVKCSRNNCPARPDTVKGLVQHVHMRCHLRRTATLASAVAHCGRIAACAHTHQIKNALKKRNIAVIIVAPKEHHLGDPPTPLRAWLLSTP